MTHCQLTLSCGQWLLVLVLGWGFGCARTLEDRTVEPMVPKRIVSLAPSITESLFALGLGDRVVGVTSFCNFPLEAQSVSRIGGYLKPNYEAIMGVNPDLVITLTEHERENLTLSELGLKNLQLDHRGVGAILESLLRIGVACGAGDKAEGLVAEMQTKIDRVKQRSKGRAKPRVLISIGRKMGSATLSDTYVAAPGTFYHELIELAGGENSIPPSKVSYPTLSTEGMLRLNPQVIVDMVSDLKVKGLNPRLLEAEWRSLGPEVEAVRNDRILVLGEDYVTVPGPRFLLLLEDLSRVIHPPGR